MASKFIKLNWTRPITADYPKIWRTFVGRDVDRDKLVEYRIEDLTESRFDDAIKHLEEFYLKDEPVAQVLGACNDKQYVADYGMVCRSVLQQKSSFVCFRDSSDEIVGVSTSYVITKDDRFGKEAYERCQSPKTKRMYDVDSVLTNQFNVFHSYGISEYLYLHNLAVDKRFRGRKIGSYFFETEIDFCRQSNIKLVHGIFTSDSSCQLSEAAGFKQDSAISSHELIKRRPEFGVEDIRTKEIALKSLIV